VTYPVVELRQYTLRPGQRDVLVELFDREFVESQEELGMAILGQFRDLDDPDRFVWLRGFPDLATRAGRLQTFYSGPIWKKHAAAANATMLDSDNVLLLRPVEPGSGFVLPAERRPSTEDSTMVATIHYRDRPFGPAFVGQFRRAAAQQGVVPLALFWTEYAENTLPALPVRTGEHVFVWFSREVADLVDLPTDRLRLAPTPRSLLR
jgi:NIPSNAP